MGTKSSKARRASDSQVNLHADAACSSREPTANSSYARANSSDALSPVAGGIEQGQLAVEDTNNQLGYWYLVKHGYENLVNLIIRPPRAKYEMKDLGPNSFNFCGRAFQRIDFEMKNERGSILQCSHWQPIGESRIINELPCLIYLHGNSSSRIEALSILRCALSSGATVVAFDCAGCGKSEGEYISLGYYERGKNSGNSCCYSLKMTLIRFLTK